MKTAVYLNTFAKMANYDLASLSNDNIKPIAIVAEEEYTKFNNAYKKYFSDIFTCKNESANEFEKISYQFAYDIIQEQKKLNDDIRIICLSEDNLLLAATLRDDFKIPGMKFNDALPFRDKVIMKNVLKTKKIRTPRYCKFDDAQAINSTAYFEHLKQLLGLPFILKPTSLLGGLGVMIIDSSASFAEFCQNKPANLDYEIEEFISGTLFHCDSIRQNNKTIFSVCCEYTHPNFDFQLGKNVVSMALQNNDPLAQRINAFNEEVLNALNYEQGISHHELFLTKQNELVFLEIAARSPGALVTPMYRRAFNIGLEDIDFKMQMDLPFDLKPIYDAHFLSGIFPNIPGKIEKLVTPQLKSKIEMNWVVKEGDYLSPSKSLREKSATIIAWNSNHQELQEDFNILKDFQSVAVV